MFYAVRNTAHGSYVAAFHTAKEAQDFIKDNTVNGQVKGGMPGERYIMVPSPADMSEMWRRMEMGRLREERKKSGNQ